MSVATKSDAYDKFMTSISKKYGNNTVVKLNSDSILDVEVIPTGSLGLDKALGVGGFPLGRIIEIYGPEASGKTSICLHTIANAQKSGDRVILIDAEHSFDPVYAKSIGVDIDELHIAQPYCGEEALDILKKAAESGAFKLAVVDSVAALVPQSELEGEVGDAQMGKHARLMSQGMRMITGALSRSSCCCIFTNQLRSKIGVMFGPSETTTGGNALKFYASIRIEVRGSTKIKDGNDTTGNLVKAKIVKNKCAPPYKATEFDIIYGKGISISGEVVDMACEAGFMEKSGAWYKLDGQNIAQGRENAKAYLESNPEILNNLYTQILQN